MKNYLEDYTDEQAVELCERILRETDQDLNDRRDWDDKVEMWTRLWACEPPKGDGPWPGSSNVVVPLVASASEQAHNRAYAAHFDQPTSEMCKCKPVAKNDVERSRRVEHFLNWQLAADIEEFEPEHDRLLSALPKDGVAWKKWWWDEKTGKPACMFVPGTEVIVPYNTRPYQANKGRITHRYEMHTDDIQKLVKEGFFYLTDEHLAEKVEDAKVIGGKDESVLGGSGSTQSDPNLKSPAQQASDSIMGHEAIDADTELHTIFERHELIVLPNDMEIHAIVWIDASEERVLRITSRATEGNENVIHQFIDYHFIWSPYGFYSYGYGHFLGPLNEIANTIFNQYIDAGKVSNLPFLFYQPGSGLRTRDIKLAPGDAVPVRDVTQIKMEKMAGLDGSLAQLLTIIDRYGSDMSDNTDEARGRVQKGVREPTVRGQNARLEQTLMGFGVKIRRMIFSLGREFQLLYELDSAYVEDAIEHRILGDTDKLAFNKIDREDFGKKLDIIPTASPSFTSRAQMRQEVLELTDTLIKMPNALAPRADGTVRLAELGDELLRRLLRSYSYGELIDYVPEPPAPPKSPGEEHQTWLEGEVPPTSDADNHAQHVTKHTLFIMVDGGKLEPEILQQAQEHIMEHNTKERARLGAQSEAPTPFDQSVPTIGGEGGAPAPQSEPGTDFSGQPGMGAA